ncbi:hypothetical protein [Lysobacter brunescens]|uniref:Uncharacterized protein n=1 Tax=Lysobacter brunescens TaxID=262323 RepID=A0ABW2YGL7_9GAMM
MIDQFLNAWQFNVWLGLASLGAGLVVVAPCLLVPSWRRRILRSDVDIEGVDLIALTVLIVAIGCYNYFSGR